MMPLYHILSAAIILGAMMGMAGCAPLIGAHGHHVPSKKLQALRLGVSTQENARQLLGSPSVVSLDGNRLWLYMSRETEAWIPTFETETGRRTIAIYFNRDGKVRGKRILTAAQGRALNFVPDTTPTPIAELNWLQRLFGNIGQVRPSNIPSGTP